ncbi:hypothetical protein CQ13_34660 [Bradyrhizobium retamae]|uniref:Uncharacterized protein n=1 Tax=Bradyrhizobium retamae TaxID=1300035 RepID=A0A0R3MEE6_9BRAD|nr:hypothetical protein CQ13_34660 [Bradyrhizobium retamae]
MGCSKRNSEGLCCPNVLIFIQGMPYTKTMVRDPHHATAWTNSSSAIQLANAHLHIGSMMLPDT